MEAMGLAGSIFLLTDFMYTGSSNVVGGGILYSHSRFMECLLIRIFPEVMIAKCMALKRRTKTNQDSLCLVVGRR